MPNYNRDAIALRQLSAEAGRKWAIFGDEQPPAHTGVMPDADDPTHDEPRIEALWGNLMGGGGGVEWYFGSQVRAHGHQLRGLPLARPHVGPDALSPSSSSAAPAVLGDGAE